jgi:hypothetical protein
MVVSLSLSLSLFSKIQLTAKFSGEKVGQNSAIFKWKSDIIFICSVANAKIQEN